MDEHHAHMGQALRLAQKGLGCVWPNPSVGCVIVKNGRIVARAYTAAGGRPHGETIALIQAGENAWGSDVYVTLEPCSHNGQTPPCVEALIKARVKRVFIALKDPDPRVSGRGIARLKEAGVEVVLDVCAKEAFQLQRGFLFKVLKNRPFVALKLATSLDGKIATRTGESQWITGALARQQGHSLRAQYDAICVGRATVEADNPTLTCRLPGLEDKSPVRLILDSNLKLAKGAFHIFEKTTATPTWVFHTQGDKARITNMHEKGVKTFQTESVAGQVDLEKVLFILARQGITRLLIEGGPRVATSFLKAGLVDRLYWFQSPQIIGGDGISALSALGVEHLLDSVKLRALSQKQFGVDKLIIYEGAE